ncbi:GTSE1 protein, partial [Brachypteracias leptosomus]|nr:GTSE1 protein [Brachypteracias leptosomus]
SGNEDEVFVGPLGHKEKCIAVNIETKENTEKKNTSASDGKLIWSSLTEKPFEEISKEAHLLALQIQKGSKNEQTKISQSEEWESMTVEKFVEDSKLKLKILRNLNIEKSPRAVKRETYCVQGSPACQLPPCFQEGSDKPLSDDKAHALHTPPNRSPVKIHESPTEMASSLLSQEQKTKGRNTKATGKLSMAKPPSTLGKNNLLILEKPKPGEHTSISTKRDLNSIGSSEELISDKSSAASDVFESFFSGSSSAQDKKALPAPSKPGLKKIINLKLPDVASGLTKTTSLSSSSVSSISSSPHSSLSISPIGKNGKSSMSSKASVSGSKLSSRTGRLALVRPTRLSSWQAANPEKSREQARPASASRISSAVNLSKSSASATTSEAVGSGIQRLSSVPNLQKLCQQNKDGSATKGSLCPKPRARVLSALASQTKAPVKTGDTPTNKLAPKATPSLGLTFCGTLASAMVVSTPVKASGDGVFPERSVSMTPASLKRSGLPVRRISGFPAVTPKTAPRVAFSPHVASVRQSSSFSTKKSLTAGFKQTKESKTQISSSEDDTSPPPVLPLALDFSPEKTATEALENELEEAEVQNQLPEEKQTE